MKNVSDFYRSITVRSHKCEPVNVAASPRDLVFASTMFSTRFAAARLSRRVLAPSRRLLSSQAAVNASKATPWLVAGTVAVVAASMPVPMTSNEIMGPIKEASTGILFPALCNGFHLAGTGVRIKYAFFKVYAVGTYVDPVSLQAVKQSPAAIEQALLDPTYPRTIRIVMNRGLSVEKFTAGIVESLEPRMMGQDLDK